MSEQLGEKKFVPKQLLGGSNQHSIFAKEYFLAVTVVLALEVENQQKH